MDAIRFDNVSKKYKKILALDGISVCIRKGEIVGIVGVNGAGKTTFLKAICGLVKVSGNIEVCGINVKKTPQVLKKIGALIEAPSIYPFLSGYENAKLIQNISPECTEEDIDRVLDMVGLKERSHEKTSGYSLGMKQRLGIALSLLRSPEVLLLDEPTNGLDPVGIHDVREIIKSYHNNTNATIVISSHNLPEIQTVCDSFIFMDQGKIKRYLKKDNIETDLESEFLKIIDKPYVETTEK